MGASLLRVDNVLVILACTLGGGVDRGPWEIVRRLNGTSHPYNRSSRFNLKGNSTCTAGGGQWRDCAELDATIHPVHMFAPWCCAFATVVVLGMPTILLRSRAKEKGLCLFTGILVQYLGLLGCGVLMAGHPAVCFVFSLHASVRFLSSIEATHVLVGGGGWWSLRYVSVVSILVGQLVFGPPVAVVHWQGVAVESGVSCAYLSHLVGCVGPDMALSGVRCFVAFARYIHLRDD